MYDYAPQAGLDEDKKHFWKDLDKIVRGMQLTTKLFIGGDVQGHIGSTKRDYDDVHGGFGFGDMNESRATLLEFVRGFGLVVANSSFRRRNSTWLHSAVRWLRLKMIFLLLKKANKSLCKDGKVIPSQNLATQHKHLVMNLEIKKNRKKRVVDDPPRIK
ncbi:uncharacterized protein LOC124894717 [Capsicum annuum]|uniref:uncharacterized protein LOC124894717 n=1 Tax=Capsicum annuum TaxID=4072 RepID=UPI001FB1877C|nr:uncharacterized protein LOC124894717 [Capsicum annuum]